MLSKQLAIVFVTLIFIGLAATESLAYYHSQLGRWLTRDPGLGGEKPIILASQIDINGEISGQTHPDPRVGGANPYFDGMNLYLYVSSIPTLYLDPLGLQGHLGNFREEQQKAAEKRRRGGICAPPKPENHEGFHHYGNWGGAGWANGGWNYESCPLPKPCDPDYKPPVDDRDACYEEHDRCINPCPAPTNDPRGATKCIRNCDHKLADCLRKAGYDGWEAWAFDGPIPFYYHAYPPKPGPRF